MKRGVKSKYINSLCDRILYDIPPDTNKRVVFEPIMAGITDPSPDYFVDRRHTNLRMNNLIFVFEYVFSGTGHLEYGEKKYTVHEGDFYMINRCVNPYYYSDAKNPFSKIWLNIQGSYVNSLADAFFIPSPILILHFNAEPYIQKIQKLLCECPQSQVENAYPEMMHILLDLFIAIRQEQSRERETMQKESVNIRTITDYIEGNVTYNLLSVAYLSKKFFISESTLYRSFMKEFGISPKQYIMREKLQYAKQLLRNTQFTVKKISEILNFPDSNYFLRVFKNAEGMPPTQWKKKYLPE